MRTPDLQSERGIALAIAVFAMVVIGGIVSATFYMGFLSKQFGIVRLFQRCRRQR